mmetsp:Transcript_54151/g.144256  ORF Transcript_54151/g.144256 Transcript_54151/m.144256 type:complete len:133 (+) Transcript_54151:4160-4558(+)
MSFFNGYSTTGGGGAPMRDALGRLKTHRGAFTHHNAVDPAVIRSSATNIRDSRPATAPAARRTGSGESVRSNVSHVSNVSSAYQSKPYGALGSAEMRSRRTAPWETVAKPNQMPLETVREQHRLANSTKAFG